MSDVKARNRIATVVHILADKNARGALRVVINQGTADGLKLGDKFLIYGIGPHIEDVHSGADLGPIEEVRGQGEVVDVQQNTATIQSIEGRLARLTKSILSVDTLLLDLLVPGLGLLIARPKEEDLAPEAEIPFDSVQLGDLAKPI